MDNNTIVHDLTMLILDKTVSDYTPETIVNAYEELKSQVTETYYNHPNHKPKEARVLSRRDLNI